MTNQQGAPEALRLADALQAVEEGWSIADKCCAELRRLHAENERLAALVDAQQPAPSAAGDVFDEPDEVIKLRALAATCYAGLGAECNLPENWLDALNAAANGEPFTTSGLLPYKAQPSPTPQADSTPAADPDGEAFRTAARLGLTLRFYGGCAQSSIPGTPSAYEVVAGHDRATAMREAVERAAEVIAKGGEPQRLDSSAPRADSQPAPATWLTDPAPTPEREFAEWLNERRGFPVSAVFHEIMRKFAARAPADSVTAPAGEASMREDFEAYWRSKYAPLPMNTRLHDDGRYGDPTIQQEWESWRAMHNPTPPAQAADSVLEDAALTFTSAHIDYVARSGGRCRDCADESGVCPGSGLPCGSSRKAIKHVFDALEYGVKNGFIKSPVAARKEGGV